MLRGFHGKENNKENCTHKLYLIEVFLMKEKVLYAPSQEKTYYYSLQTCDLKTKSMAGGGG